MAISIRDLEEAAAAGWRAPEETVMKGDRRGQGRWVGGGGEVWLLRGKSASPGGLTARSRPVTPACRSPMRSARSARLVHRARAARAGLGRLPHRRSGRRPGGPVPRRARLAGALRRGDRDDRRVRRCGGAAARRGRGPMRVDLAAEPDEAWLEAVHRFQAASRCRRSPAGCCCPRRGSGSASAREEGRTIAVGRVAVADGWGLASTAVEVDPAHRSTRGLGHAITATRWPRPPCSAAPPTLYLQVENDTTRRRAPCTRQAALHRPPRLPLPGSLRKRGEAREARKAHGEQEERGRSVRGTRAKRLSAHELGEGALSMLYSTIRSIGSRSGKSPSRKPQRPRDQRQVHREAGRTAGAPRRARLRAATGSARRSAAQGHVLPLDVEEH